MFPNLEKGQGKYFNNSKRTELKNFYISTCVRKITVKTCSVEYKYRDKMHHY